MTTNQIAAARHFRQRNIGALRFEGRWIYSVDLKTDAALADRFVASL